jgi:hypothetical protein
MDAVLSYLAGRHIMRASQSPPAQCPVTPPPAKAPPRPTAIRPAATPLPTAWAAVATLDELPEPGDDAIDELLAQVEALAQSRQAASPSPAAIRARAAAGPTPAHGRVATAAATPQFARLPRRLVPLACLAAAAAVLAATALWLVLL